MLNSLILVAIQAFSQLFLAPTELHMILSWGTLLWPANALKAGKVNAV